MSHVSLFAYGAVTPVFAYLVAFLGSLLGVLCVSRARVAERSSRTQWLIAASVALGGTGVWTAHFIAMLGFDASGLAVRYNVWFTLLSVCVALPAVGIGVFLAFQRGARPGLPLAAGTLAGLGMTGMHYLSVASINLPAQVAHNRLSIWVTLFFAVAAATTAFWLMVRVHGRLLSCGAALVMGVGFWLLPHLLILGMSAGPDGTPVPPGATKVELLIPTLGIAGLVTLGILLSIMLTPSETEIQAEAELLAQVQARATRREIAVSDPFRPASFADPAPRHAVGGMTGSVHTTGPLPVFSGGPEPDMPAESVHATGPFPLPRDNGAANEETAVMGVIGDGVRDSDGPFHSALLKAVTAGGRNAEEDSAEQYSGSLFRPRR